MKYFFFVLLLLMYVSHCSSANILAFLPTFARSHYGGFQPLLKELAVRGHNVTVLSHFALKNPPPNYHHIDVSKERQNDNNFSILSIAPYLKPLVIPIGTLFFGSQITLETLNNTKVKEFIHSDGYQFDVVIFENFQHECFVSMSHKFSAHAIQLFPATPIAFTSQWYSQPFNPSYIPDPNSGYKDQMSLFERTINFLVTCLQFFLFPIFYMPKQNEIMLNYFNYTGSEFRPSLEEMTKNISLTLINTHFTLGTARPLVPSFIEVAGMHLKPASKLPKDLQELMDNSPDGVVYFSFGSVVKGSHLPKHQVEMFLRQLGQIKQKVLWKWESDDLPELPPNVVVNKWFPQVDILGHPNCVLFITHGGIHSIEEAVYYGVPMLAISIFGDQLYNSIMMESRGAAIRLKYSELNENRFSDNLHDMLSNISYKQNAIKLSKIFHDQPMKPLDKAVYWIEYVIRHNGAHHLKTAGNQLNWIQYLSIDVMLVLLSTMFLILIISFYTMKKMYKWFIRYRKHHTETNDDKKEN
ncbi:UDP-glucuronosyltransferase 2C1 [Acyrthosiphon pisum]|uniref:UDP-glucuronosyltransferase n=1 Tax=Acyrthosiphon pisum TaxID=7029 RepID=A0A8R2JPI6_ACYPI|nr:UDP-glucuronosyltransferase 2C1 [Acyrthosiphon pisum]XP_029343209.1 UDP-glucuronosyltransferase 2C1 [Acyrthosiphon pisum]XP_029343210.1 UDP-glucuronosyltransferase 2C1 [Acyrthosiphon pisum]|eukprot:XP_008186378.1 PREDICTED: UDP-glucuronosyltransferase 2C1 isoform X2 [Acyrthosiphon pisum]